MKQKKAKMSLEKKHNLTGWAFLIPAALLIFIFCFYPMIQAIILSFTKKGSGFAGLANYQRILKDKTFQQCLFNTVFYFIIQVPVMLLLVIEGLTTALTTIWFAGGALAAAIAAGIGMGIVPQLLLFFCVSLVLLFFTRPAALKLMRKDTEKTNVEGLLGKKAVVIQKINNLAQTGQVRINDIEWMARTSDDSVTIPVDTVVIIKAVHGVKLIVEPKEA